MKKQLIPVIAVLMASTTPAMADQTVDQLFFKPVVGADYSYTHMSLKSGFSGPSNYNGGDIHIGARFHPNFGIEASLFDNAKTSKDGFKAKLDGSALDLLGYYPIEATKLELIGTLGVAHTKLTVPPADDSETKLRYGVGAQYWVSEHLNVRGLVRYQDDNSRGSLDSNIVTATLGINWQFK